MVIANAAEEKAYTAKIAEQGREGRGEKTNTSFAFSAAFFAISAVKSFRRKIVRAPAPAQR